MPATSTQSPRVQFPVGADYHGLSIDGEFVYAWPEEDDHPGDENLPSYRDYLPERANDAYWAHFGADNHGRVYQCTECGYLTMSKNARASAYRKTTCTNCEKNGKTSTSWRHVYPDPVNEENKVDVLAARSAQAEFDPEQPMSGPEVPNHPSHLSRIQNQLSGHVTRGELQNIVANAVQEARKNGHIDY